MDCLEERWERASGPVKLEAEEFAESLSVCRGFGRDHRAGERTDHSSHNGADADAQRRGCD
jgi:hypothetical protein